MAALAATDEEEEKTTIESGWEEEASTTVEQGEVAEKIRSLGSEPPANGRRQQQITSVTSTTNGSGVNDEPTVDDQRAMAGMSLITPPMLSRLVITGGNDSGREIEIQPGKSYTVGRAIDNDVVLTDIAVSRKHFDLKFEAGAWIVVDRGSGNGTLVNGNIEDAPFALANGDAIEIGNTVFRFEAPNGMPPARRIEPPPSQRHVAPEPAPYAPPIQDHYDIDEEEPSTVAGKPVREDPPTPAQMPVPPVLRPKTVPPPSPRPRTLSAPPPPHRDDGLRNGFPAQGSVPSVPIPQAPPPLIPALQPQPPLPPPPPVQISPQALAMQAQIGSMPMRNPQGQATTLPLPNRAPMPAMQPTAAMPSSMPNAGPPSMPGQMQMHQQMHPQMLGEPLPGMMPTTIPGQGPPMQPSSPHMQPLPFTYPNVNEMPPQHASHPLLVQPNGIPRNDVSTMHVPPMTYNPNSAVAVQTAYKQPFLSRRTKLLLGGAGLTILAAVVTIAIIKGTSSDDSSSNDSETAEKSKPEMTPLDPPKETPKPPDKETKTEPIVAKKETPKPPDKPDPLKDIKLDAKLLHEPKVRVDAATKLEMRTEPSSTERKDGIATKDLPPKDPPKQDPPKQDPPKQDPPKQEPKITKQDPPKQDPPKQDPPKQDPPKQATAVDLGDIKARADAAYRNKQFKDAASMLRVKASTLTGKQASELTTRANQYETFGASYFVGMGQGTSPRDALQKLLQAQAYDKQLGGVYLASINDQIPKVAIRAAIAYMGAHDYPSANTALLYADAGSADAVRVRRELDSQARQLLAEAQELASSKPDEAKAKIRMVNAITAPSSPLRQKAAAIKI